MHRLRLPHAARLLAAVVLAAPLLASADPRYTITEITASSKMET